MNFDNRLDSQTKKKGGIMKYGFTGSRGGTTTGLILKTLISLKLKPNDIIITGACIGIDSQVSHITEKYFGYDIDQIIIVPYNKRLVDKTLYATASSIYGNGKIIYMPSGTNYRDRNTEIVRRCDKLIAFWNGHKQYSGTYMTINIAKKMGVPITIINI